MRPLSMGSKAIASDVAALANVLRRVTESPPDERDVLAIGRALRRAKADPLRDEKERALLVAALDKALQKAARGDRSLSESVQTAITYLLTGSRSGSRARARTA